MNKTIAGKQIDLDPGFTYVAAHPVCSRNSVAVPVRIRKVYTSGNSKEVKVISGFTYDEATTFVNEFNGERGLGRVWQ